MVRRFIWCAGSSLALMVPIWGAVVWAQEERLDYRPIRLMAPLRPITAAEIVAADAIGDAVQDRELVIGVKVGDETRAYPINMLCGPRREIINETVGGRPIAATW